MKTLRAARLLASSTVCRSSISYLHLNPISRFFSSAHLEKASADTSDDSAPDFDSQEFSLPSSSPAITVSRSSSVGNKKFQRWDNKYREKADQVLFGEVKRSRLPDEEEEGEVGEDEEEKERANMLAEILLESALRPPDDAEDEHMEVKVENQKSLSVGIVGAPNAGKSSLTNYMVGTKVSAVSRKTNTTIHEILGVMTKGNTQICFFDTPGLVRRHHGYPYKSDVKVRAESTWSFLDLYDFLIVIFDVHRHITKPDTRVKNLIINLGAKAHEKQKRVLCMNKVDLLEDKKALLKVAKEFEDLPGYERYFMISGLKGSGVKDLIQHLMDQAVKRPWDEEPTTLTEETMKAISLEVVREKMMNHIHQEIPYAIEHHLMDWKELRDGSLRVEQHLITPKPSQRPILIGKNGSKIGRIGIESNEELRSIFKREVHLILKVEVARKKGA